MEGLIKSSFVIDVTTSYYSTKPASWQVAGYPAKAGIQCFASTRFADYLLTPFNGLDTGIRRCDGLNQTFLNV